MLTLAQIIAEADVRVPNAFSEPDKINWINEVNNQFFDVVKIPQTIPFIAQTGVGEYTLTNSVHSKNIDKVTIGTMRYQSNQYEDVQPGRGWWDFDDVTHKLTVSPPPIESDNGMVRCFRIATTTFLAGDLTAKPDAPDEYHWIYILGLSERIAKAQNDVGLANNYAGEFKDNLTIAAQNFQKGVRR